VTTTPDRTDYIQVLPAANVEAALWLTSSNLGYPDPLLHGAHYWQQTLVAEERTEQVDDVPANQRNSGVMAALFPDGHPYHRPVLGTADDLAATLPTDSVAFATNWHQPQEAILVVLGDVDKVAMHALVERYFAPLPAVLLPKRPVAPKEAPSGEQVLRSFDVGSTAAVRFAWRTPACFADGDAESHLLAAILDARLERHAEQRPGVVWSSVSNSAFENGGVFTLSLVGREGASSADVQAIAEAQIEELRTRPPTSEELEWAERRRETGRLQRFDGAAGLVTWATALRDYRFFLGNADRAAWDLARYRAVTVFRIQTFAAALLRPERRVVLLVEPTAGHEAQASAP